MSAVEIPAWAWGLIVLVLTGGFGTLGKMLSYYAGQIDKRLDGHDEEIGDLRKRQGKVENRVTALEARSSP